MESYAPAILLSYVTPFAPHFTEPSLAYFGGYLSSLLIARGRKTTSQVAHTRFFIDRHLSRWERFLSENEWDLNAVLDTLIQTIIDKMGDALEVHGAYLAAVDPISIARGGERMSGVQPWKDHGGNADRGPTIRGHHWAVLGLIAFSATWGRYVCFPLLMRVISGQIDPCQFFVDPRGVATVASFWDCIHPMVWHLQDLLGDAPLRVVADAYFSKAPFVNPLVEGDIDVVTRLRRDAVGWDDPSPDQRSDAERGEKWKLAHLLDRLPVQTPTVHLYGERGTVRAVSRILRLRNFSHKVEVVVVEGAEETIILLSADLSLPAAQIIEIYGARFSIELAIRGLKQHFGLADYRCYLGTAIHRFVHLAYVAFCVYRLVQLREDTSGWLPPVPDDMSPASLTHLRQALQRHIIRRILAPESRKTPNLEASSSELEAIIRVVG